MYKYQILYLDRITIVAWRHLVNDINLRRSAESPKKIHKTPYFGVQGHSRSFNSTAIESQCIYDFLLVFNSNLGHISHRYWDTATYWPKIANFAHPLSLSALVRGDPFWIYAKALRFL